MKIWICILLVLWAAAAFAEPITTKDNPCVGVTHKPAPDVAYSPGVDTKPADLNPPILSDKEVADAAVIGLGAPVSNYIKEENYNFPTNQRSGVDVGVITLNEGKASFNGQPLEQADSGCKTN